MNAVMIKAAARNATILAGWVAAGFLCLEAAGYLTSARGAIGPTVLQAESPALAVIAIVVCTALAMLVAAGVGRLTNTVVGLFVLGGGLYALTHRMATFEELARSGGSMVLVAVETLLWAVLLFGAVLAVFRLSGPLKDLEPVKGGGSPPHPLFSAEAWKMAMAGLIVLPVVWVWSQTPLKGQVATGVVVGGFLAGMAGRMWIPTVQPVLIFVSPVVAGAIGHVVGVVLLKAPIGEAFISDTVPPLCLPMPIDYAAGTLLGVALGLGQAKSFMQGEESEAEDAKKGPIAQGARA